MSNDTLTKTIVIAAPKATVWAYLTDKEKLGTWFNPARDDLTAGAAYELFDKENDQGAKCHGKVLEMDAPNRMSMTFSITPMGDFETKVSWTLTEVEGGTKLTLVHEGMAQAGFGWLSGIDAGWDKHFETLRSVATA